MQLHIPSPTHLHDAVLHTAQGSTGTTLSFAFQLLLQIIWNLRAEL